MPSIIDSYSETNKDASAALYSGFATGIGQSFTVSSTSILHSIKGYLAKTGAPTGNTVAKIYNLTGTHGTDATPTGAALAISNNLDVATLTTSFQLLEILFTGVNNITLNAGNYVMTFEYSGGDASNSLLVGVDNSSPTHAGNQSALVGTWAGFNTSDTVFYVYAADATTTSISSSTSSTSSTSSSTSTSTSSTSTSNSTSTSSSTSSTSGSSSTSISISSTSSSISSSSSTSTTAITIDRPVGSVRLHFVRARGMRHISPRSNIRIRR